MLMTSQPQKLKSSSWCTTATILILITYRAPEVLAQFFMKLYFNTQLKINLALLTLQLLNTSPDIGDWIPYNQFS